MGEREVGQFVVHFVLVVTLVFQHSLEFQGFIRLNEVKLLLSLVITDLLLIDNHLLSKVIQKLVILEPLLDLEHISLLLVLIYLVYDGLQELLLVARRWVELDPLCEPLASPSLNERTQEWVRNVLLFYGFSLFRLLLL